MVYYKYVYNARYLNTYHLVIGGTVGNIWEVCTKQLVVIDPLIKGTHIILKACVIYSESFVLTNIILDKV